MTTARSVSLHNIFAVNLASGFEPRFSPSMGDSGSGDRYLVRIWDTHHYQVLAGKLSWKEYEEYVNIVPQPEHDISTYRALADKFDGSHLRDYPIKVRPIKGDIGRFQILDGVHRLSLWFFHHGHLAFPREFLTGTGPDRDITFAPSGLRRVKKKLARYNSSSLPNGWNVARGLEYGYHSFQLGNLNTKGQRVPEVRLNSISAEIDLRGKRVLDLGCSAGGMLFHQIEIGLGIGWDLDSNGLAVAQEVKRQVMKSDPEFATRFSFFQRDLDSSVEAELVSTIIKNQIDIIFMLSMGSWLRRWKELLSILTRIGVPIVLETNNDSEGRAQLEFLVARGYQGSMCSASSVDDTTGNHGRKTWVFRPQIAGSRLAP